MKSISHICMKSQENIPHNYLYSIISNSDHMISCACCDYTMTQPHNLVYVNVSDQYHRKECTECGYKSANSLHILRESELGNRYKKCTVCGIHVITGGDNIFPIEPTETDKPIEETDI